MTLIIIAPAPDEKSGAPGFPFQSFLLQTSPSLREAKRRSNPQHLSQLKEQKRISTTILGAAERTVTTSQQRPHKSKRKKNTSTVAREKTTAKFVFSLNKTSLRVQEAVCAKWMCAEGK